MVCKCVFVTPVCEDREAHEARINEYEEHIELLPDINPLLEAGSVIKDLNARIQYLVDYIDGEGRLEEHCFTFPDGETWWSSKSKEKG